MATFEEIINQQIALFKRIQTLSEERGITDKELIKTIYEQVNDWILGEKISAERKKARATITDDQMKFLEDLGFFDLPRSEISKLISILKVERGQ